MIPTLTFLGCPPCHVSFSMRQVKILKSSWLHSLSRTTWSILSALLLKYTQNLTSSNHSHNGSLVQAITTPGLAAYLASILLGLLPSVCSQHSRLNGSLRIGDIKSLLCLKSFSFLSSSGFSLFSDKIPIHSPLCPISLFLTRYTQAPVGSSVFFKYGSSLTYSGVTSPKLTISWQHCKSKMPLIHLICWTS